MATDSGQIHGTTSEYARGCRCDDCRLAKSEENRRYAASRPKRNRVKSSQDRAYDREYSRAYYAANPDKVRETKRAYDRRRTAARRANSQRRRARMREADHGCVSTAAFVALWEFTHGLCIYCGAPAEHMDHIQPIAKGGLHCVENLVPACATCNLHKADRILDAPPPALMPCAFSVLNGGTL